MSSYSGVWKLAKHNALSDGLKIIEHGWEQHVIIDEQQGVVYRYPRHKSAADKLADEVAVLEALGNIKWPVQIPRIISHTDDYTSYIYIVGEVLNHFNLAHIHDSDVQEIGKGLGQFLSVLHTVPVATISHKKTKQTMSLLEYYRRRIESNHNASYYDKAAESLRRLIEATLDTPFDLVVHGDLHGLNMVVDMQKKRLHGVIDFSELEIGSSEQDFRKIFMADQRLLTPAIQNYFVETGITPREEVVKLWAYVNEWANVCHFSGQTTNGTYLRAQSHLRRWGQL